jgi:hypothetical protein
MNRGLRANGAWGWGNAAQVEGRIYHASLGKLIDACLSNHLTF